MRRIALVTAASAALAAVSATVATASADVLAQQSIEVFDVAEFSLPATPGGNRFDVQAAATFTHAASGQVITTPMFYNGDGTYRFRFNGVAPGEWTYITASPVAALNGQAGSVTVTPAADPAKPGFTIGVGNQWARQTAANLSFFDGHAETFEHSRSDQPDIVWLRPAHVNGEFDINRDGVR